MTYKNITDFTKSWVPGGSLLVIKQEVQVMTNLHFAILGIPKYQIY